jgi:hypothetical protein
VLYAALVAWEQKHVAHHLRALKRMRDGAQPNVQEPAVPAESRIAA